MSLLLDYQIRGKNADQNMVYSQAKLIFERLKEAGVWPKMKFLKLVAGGSFKSHCNWHGIAGRGEIASAEKEAVSLYLEKLKVMIEEGGYSSQTVFIADVTGLFWKKMPFLNFFSGLKAAKD